MNSIKMLSWNVNGIRAAFNKGFIGWFLQEAPDILCLQETKASEEQFPVEITAVEGYHAYFSAAERRGYSGVALYSREKPLAVTRGFGISRFDSEGRIIVAEYRSFTLYNIYFPNGKASRERLQYKMAFYDAFLDHLLARKNRGEKLIVCGDVNTAHREIDLARPRENEKVSGFLPEERAWIDAFIAHGFIDIFRVFNQGADQYTWWDYKTRARERNIGWRIDYFFVSENIKKNVRSAFLLSEVMGSDHCPIGITLVPE